jgi:hypothetical protein
VQNYSGVKNCRKARFKRQERIQNTRIILHPYLDISVNRVKIERGDELEQKEMDDATRYI